MRLSLEINFFYTTLQIVSVQRNLPILTQFHNMKINATLLVIKLAIHVIIIIIIM